NDSISIGELNSLPYIIFDGVAPVATLTVLRSDDKISGRYSSHLSSS
ncbi:hypothetical protein A3Q56_08630, partial [Intoshia linei]